MRNKVPEIISPASSLQSPSSENAEPQEKLQLQFAPSALEPVKLPSPSSNVNQAQNPEASAALAGTCEFNSFEKKNLAKTLKIQKSYLYFIVKYSFYEEL